MLNELLNIIVKLFSKKNTNQRLATRPITCSKVSYSNKNWQKIFVDDTLLRKNRRLWQFLHSDGEIFAGYYSNNANGWLLSNSKSKTTFFFDDYSLFIQFTHARPMLWQHKTNKKVVHHKKFLELLNQPNFSRSHFETYFCKDSPTISF